MRWRKKTLGRALLLAAVLVLVAGVMAPFVRADRFSTRIRKAVEQAMGRKVEIAGPVRLKLFPRPGFSVGNVIIHDDPAMGLEPFAYVTSLEVGVRLSSLWRRRLEFSNLRLVAPSVNLVKSRAGSWNYLPLLDRAFGPSPADGTTLPAIQVRSGRLNFKFGDTKSVFYFSNADIDVSPSSGPEDALRLRFSGEPAWTDRSARGFGAISGGGRLILSREGETRVALNVRLQRSAIAEVLTLLRGYGMGLEGFVASEARLEGPVSNIEITGRLELAEIDRWSLLPSPGGQRSLDYKGRLNVTAQTMTLETAAAAEPPLPVAVRFRVDDYLAQPRWAFTVALEELPIESLPELARRTGFRLPEDLAVEGSATGTLDWSSAGRFEGELTLRNVSVEFPNSTPIQFEEANLAVDGGRLHLSPTEVVLGEGQRARVEILYLDAMNKLDVTLGSRALAVSRLQSLWTRLTGGPAPPLLSACRSGTFQGSLRYAREAGSEGMWTGSFELRDTQVAPQGFADPLEINSASVTLAGQRFEMKNLDARMGQVELEGEYSYDADAERPHHFDLLVAALDVTELERLLMPALHRRPRGFLARTLRLGPAPLPVWLAARRAEGTFRVEELVAGAVTLNALRGKAYWDGTSVELIIADSQLKGASLRGRVSVDLRETVPRYQVAAQLSGLNWEGGTVDAEGRLATTGAGTDLPLNSRAEGSFTGRAIRAGPNEEWRTVSGCFEFSMDKGVPRLLLTSIELVRGPDTYYGYGRTTLAGNLEVELFNESEELEMTGTLIPLRIEPKRKTEIR